MNREKTEKGSMNIGAQNQTEASAPANNKAKPHLKRRSKLVLILIPIILIVAGYFIYIEYFAYRESTDDAQIDGHINPIAARIDPRDYEVAVEKARADLAAARSAAEAAHTQVPITSTTTASQVNLADAVVENAEGARDAAAKEVDTARARLESMQARVRETQATYTKAMQDWERMKLLIAKDEISKQQYDAVVAAAEEARASSDSAKAGVAETLRVIEAAQARVVQAEAGIKEARAKQRASQTAKQQTAISRLNAQTSLARVKQAEAALAQAELNLEYTEVKAPVDGIVSQRKVELGQYVQTAQPLLAVVPLENVWVTANFKENQLNDMRVGQKAIITVDAYGDRRYEGHIDSIAAATGARFSLLPPENATGNYVKVVQRVPVKIVIDKGQDASYPLRPGLSVIATVITGDE